MFLSELTDAFDDREVREQVMRLRDRNELIKALQNSLLELHDTMGTNEDRRVLSLMHSLVESLHLVLETLADATMDSDDIALLRALTHDRSELMDGIRRGMQGADLPPDAQQRAFVATTLFERCMWLLRRYVMQLDVQQA